MSTTTCSIFFHNYYGQHEKWINFFSEKVNVSYNLFYNVVEDSIYNMEDNYRLAERLNNNVSGSHLNKIILRRSPNMGKDIGGKMILMDTYLRLQEESEYIIFLHDKMSPHKIQSQEWKKKLFRILEPAFLERAFAFFNGNPQTGIIADADSIHNEYNHSRKSFISNNQVQLTILRSEFGISNADHRYVAGTMFWARELPLLSFFRKHAPLDIRRNLEPGNVTDESNGTNTHAWERMLSWLIIEQGYNIKGL